MVSLFERDRKLLEYLDGLGIRPGVGLSVLSTDGALDLRAGGRPIQLEKAIGSKIWVQYSG